MMWPFVALSKRNRDGTKPSDLPAWSVGICFDSDFCSAGQLDLGFSDGCYSCSLMRAERLVASFHVRAYIGSYFRSSNSSVDVWSIDATEYKRTTGRFGAIFVAWNHGMEKYCKNGIDCLWTRLGRRRKCFYWWEAISLCQMLGRWYGFLHRKAAPDTVRDFGVDVAATAMHQSVWRDGVHHFRAAFSMWYFRNWKRNACLFEGMMTAHRQGQTKKNPADLWYEGETGFFDI